MQEKAKDKVVKPKAAKLISADNESRYREHLRRVAGPAKVGGK